MNEGSAAGGTGTGGTGTGAAAGRGRAGRGGSPGGSGTGLRLARQARGFSQQQLAGMAGISRQAVSAVESGVSDPSLRVALALAHALGMTVEELFGPGSPAPLTAVSPVAPLPRAGGRVALAPVGDRLVALPLTGATATRAGFLPAGGRAAPEDPRSRPARHQPGPADRTAAAHPARGRLRPGAAADRGTARPARPAGGLRLVAVRQQRGAAAGSRRAGARGGRAPARHRRRLQHRPGRRAAARRCRGHPVLLLARGAGAASGPGRPGSPASPTCRARACGW